MAADSSKVPIKQAAGKIQQARTLTEAEGNALNGPNGHLARAGSELERAGIRFAVDEMKRLGWELLADDFSYRGRQGVDLVFRKPKPGAVGGLESFDYAICEAKNANKGLGALRTYRNGLRQGSKSYNIDRLQQFLANRPDAPAPTRELAQRLLNEIDAGRVSSFGSMARSGRIYELLFGWGERNAPPGLAVLR